MKPKDVIRYENRFFVIIEEIDSQRIGCRCINDGEMHILWRNEVVMVQSYQKLTKSIKTHLYEFFDWFWSDKFDTIMKAMFFKSVKLIFVFCAAATVALVLIKLI
jgi:hypothetical protein